MEEKRAVEKETAENNIEESASAIKAPASLIKKMGEDWECGFVPRSKVPDFTGGLYSVGTMSNADYLKVGPKGGFRLGRQWCYPVDSLVDWLIGKLEKKG